MAGNDADVVAMLAAREARQPNRAERRRNLQPDPPPLAGAVDLAPPPKVRLGIPSPTAFIRSLDANGTYAGLVKRNPNQPNPQAPDSYMGVAEDGRAAFVDAEELAEMVARRVIELLDPMRAQVLANRDHADRIMAGADAAAFTPAP